LPDEFCKYSISHSHDYPDLHHHEIVDMQDDGSLAFWYFINSDHGTMVYLESSLAHLNFIICNLLQYLHMRVRISL
jgi:hypothetical protein